MMSNRGRLRADPGPGRRTLWTSPLSMTSDHALDRISSLDAWILTGETGRERHDRPRGSAMPDRASVPAERRMALIAHDNKKRDMLEWAEYNLDRLARHELFATATTGRLLSQ